MTIEEARKNTKEVQKLIFKALRDNKKVILNTEYGACIPDLDLPLSVLDIITGLKIDGEKIV